MIYIGVAIVFALIALAILLLSLRLLIGNWILAWLRGSAGLALLGIAVALALAGWDVRSYQQVSTTRPIATLAFSKIEDKHFNVSMVDQAGNEQRFQLSGDMWRLDARVLKWFDAAARAGLKPGYRLERLSGRYLSLSDEQKLPHSSIDLSSESAYFDIWSQLRAVNRYFSVIEAQDASASFLPMADGALYSVTVGATGLETQPVNERAKLAIEQWQ
ncbi:MAG: cation/multidrug efflux pump [Spongiibacteraceae bacterium]